MSSNSHPNLPSHPPSNPSKQYNLQTKLIHWVFLLLFIVMIVLGKVMTSVSFENPLSYYLPQYHYLLGLILLGLVIFRFKNWWANRSMLSPTQDKTLKWLVARVVQFCLLLCVTLLIISGYALATMDGTPALLPWGSWLPQLLPNDVASEQQLYALHEYSLMGFFTILFLHVSGALLNLITNWRSIKRIL
ncbi:cytochrome b [Marinicellulosiphila megalodicopiae]|uniref:cytochrome b n=1 Tax=Marinicellulosiphila megalodicopiae TaxID=2724896 RepID=UPI003BAF7DDC